MKQGWLSNDYWMLFDEAEVAELSSRYGLDAFLPGHVVLALRNWSDFVVRSPMGAVLAVPTVPIDPAHLEPVELPAFNSAIEPDPRFTNRVKWYVQPLVFGGDASDEGNVSWLGLSEHTEVVRWWNGRYQELRASQLGA